MRFDIWTCVGFTFVLLLGLFLRVRPIHESLWLDELHTAWAVSDELGDVSQRSQMGNQSPLYPWIIWGTTRTIGFNEIGLRLPSIVAGMALIAAGCFVVWKWSESRLLAMFVGFLIAIDPHSVFFAQEARAYALVQLLALLQVACFARLLLDDPSRLNRCGWIGLTWILFYVHYTGLLLLLGEVVFWFCAWNLRWSPRNVGARVLDLMLVSAGLIPAVPHLLEIASRRENWSKFVDQPNWTQVVTIFRFDAFLLAPLVVFVAFAALARVRGQRWAVPSSVIQRLVLITCWLAVPLLFAWLITSFGWLYLFFRRYLIGVGVAPMILAALVGAALPGKADRRCFALLSAIVAAALILPFRPIDVGGIRCWHSPENWRDAIAMVNDRPSLGHLPVFVRPGLIEDDGLRDPDATDELTEFCLLPVRSLYRLDERAGSIEPLPGSRSWELSTQQSDKVSAAGGAWLIVRGGPHYAITIERNVQAWLSQHGIEVWVDVRHFGNVTVLLLTNGRRA